MSELRPFNPESADLVSYETHQNLSRDAKATLSRCGRYRYWLSRTVQDQGNTLQVIMLNPSTADSMIDDPTIRKLKGFAKRWGYAEINVTNLFAFRSTKPSNLPRGEESVGQENDRFIHFALSDSMCETLVAWGATKHPLKGIRVEAVKALARGRELLCLGTNDDGSPRHPLMLPYKTKREVWV